MELNELFHQLENLEGKEYEIHKQGLPESILTSIDLLCDLFERSTAPIRQEIAARVTPGISFLFLRFSEAMAIAAVRGGDKKCIIRGLEALAIENCKGDWRDSTLILALLHHSALKIDADADGLIKNVMSLGMESGRKSLFGPFLERSLKDRDLTEFGLKEGTTIAGEFTYVSRFE